METKTLTLLTLLAAIAAQITVNTAAETVIGDDGKQWCHELAYLRELSAVLERQQTKRSRRAQDNSETTAMWTIAASAATSDKQRAAFEALAIYGHQKTAEAARWAAKLPAALSDLKKVLTKRIEALEAAAMTDAAMKVKPKGNPEPGDTQTSCALTIQAGADTGHICPKLPNGGEPAVSTIEAKLATATKIHLVDLTGCDKFITFPKVKVTAASSTAPFDTTQNVPGKCKTVLGGALTLGTHHLSFSFPTTVPEANEPQAQQIEDGNMQLPTGPEQDKVLPWMNNKLLTQQLHKAQATLKEDVTDLTRINYDHLKASAAFEGIVANVLTKQEPGEKRDSDSSKSAIKKAIEENFGPTDKEFQENFLAGLKLKDITYKKDGTDVKNSYGATTSGSGIAAALSYFTCLQLRQEETKIKTNKEQSAAPKCDGKSQEKCDGNCDWDNKEAKCKAKEEVKAEGTEPKNTNTTGISSFVIHKAPLFLAFLILACHF
ncbi:variant surface glycoprotein (VSG), putative [Trypanosoma equiperdum]|uniref:Variant surface glycoprotein (VSG), putative n=1 Tax=Trypanosoma equiperdum TaxID=5694 RepID=A0A1G4I908_TRYEQ|nr:variant surface glycoprotein (VSG), putative [Trypanosoma equiperdum]